MYLLKYMAELEDLKAERLRKLHALKDLGINPYPAKLELAGERIKSEKARELLVSTIPEGELEGVYTIAGRVMSIRGQGKILFVDLSDEDGKFQIVLKEDILGDKIRTFFDYVDGGDFVGFSGTLFVTKRGEKSLQAKDLQILSKSLLPMPSTFYGIENEEEKMRKRYLDFALNKEKRDLFVKKAIFWQTVRDFLRAKGFLEVETPTIETTTGGAEARPFKTYHNDFDLDVYMRICIGELWQKRFFAFGFEKTFEIGRAYRNEGSSPEHLQEFTNCEFYASFIDFREGMKLVRAMYINIAEKVFGKTEFTMRGHTFDLKSEWQEIDYATEIKERTGVDIFTSTEEEMKKKLTELGVKWDGDNKERLTDTLWKYCRKQIAGPAFLINHPSLVAPLAKLNSDGKTVQQFQPILAGSEVGRGYSELNDPELQRKNFEQQQKLLDSGDEEAMMPDWEFVEMLEHGMPPAFGYGFGERLFAFLAELPIRETQLFPLVKPKLN
jgi:lysyl-tRNA synthetase class 2